MVGFIDIHAVCVRELMAPVGGRHGICDVQRQIALYDRLGVEKGVIMPVANVECTPTGQANEEVLRIVAAHPDRFAAFCNLDPRNMYNGPAAKMGDVMRHYRSKGCRGVGAVCAKLPITDLRVQNLFRCAEAEGMPVAVRMDGSEDYGAGLYDTPGLPGLRDALVRFPKLTLMATGAALWCEISAVKLRDERFRPATGPVREGALTGMLRAHPNLVCDLSGAWGESAMMRDGAYAAKFLTEFRDRVTFGLGAVSPEDAAKSLPKLPAFLTAMRDSGKIAPDVFEAVTRGNAKRILGV